LQDLLIPATLPFLPWGITMRKPPFVALLLMFGSQAQAAPTPLASPELGCAGSGLQSGFPTADIVITYTPRRENDAFALAKAINRQQIDNEESAGVTLVMKAKIPDFERDKVLYNTLMSTESEAVAAQALLAACGIKSHGSWTPSPSNGDYLIRLAIGLD
jgi:hypothetical protein